MATNILLNLKDESFSSTRIKSSAADDIFKTIIEQLNAWIAFIPNLLHSLLERFDEAFPPETRAQWLAVATRFGAAALAVIAVCLFCCCCMPAIIQCMIGVVTTCWNLICGFLMLLWRLCCKVYRVCCCCGRRSVKMMKAPGTAGAVIISRALFESNPAAYFTNLRAGGIHVS